MSASDDIDDSAAPLIEHLAELRTRLIHSVMTSTGPGILLKRGSFQPSLKR